MKEIIYDDITRNIKADWMEDENDCKLSFVCFLEGIPVEDGLGGYVTIGI